MIAPLFHRIPEFTRRVIFLRCFFAAPAWVLVFLTILLAGCTALETKKASPVYAAAFGPASSHASNVVVKDTACNASQTTEPRDTPFSSEPVIQSIDFSRSKAGHLCIMMAVEGDVACTVQKQESKTGNTVFLLKKTRLPQHLARLYRVASFSAGIDSVLLRNTKEGICGTIVADGQVACQCLRESGRLVLQCQSSQKSDEGTSPLSKSHGKEVSASEDKAQEPLGFQEMNTLFPGMKKTYSGKKISIDLQDADVELVLRLIAEASGHNLVMDEHVAGKISLKLQDIPWDQALELVLLQKELGMVARGNIMRIATARQLEKERTQRRKAREAVLQARESLSKLEPLQTRYMQINYSTAAEMEPKVREFLSARGKISQDGRTNMLIIRDTGSRLDKIRAVIQTLDRPERQVLIEARIVYATDNFQRSLGINWSGSYEQGDPNSRYSRSLNISGVSLPASVSGMHAGAHFAKIAGLDLFTLDAQLRLGALKKNARTISSPRVVTLNNNRAEIKQGLKIAHHGESESGGTITQYEDALLALSVLPQITPDNKLILDLDISDDAPLGKDNISTRSTRTKMIVSNNETIVIGGVQKTAATTTEDRVPGLASIPVLGWLFKNEGKSRQKEELLIFIRPRILE